MFLSLQLNLVADLGMLDNQNSACMRSLCALPITLIISDSDGGKNPYKLQNCWHCCLQHLKVSWTPPKHVMAWSDSTCITAQALEVLGSDPQLE